MAVELLGEGCSHDACGTYLMHVGVVVIGSACAWLFSMSGVNE